jgi:hypothetical protein
MKRLILPVCVSALAAFLAIILFQLAPPVKAATIFSDDFESGSSQWTVQSGTWSIIADGSNVYNQTNTNITARSTAGSPAWTDYTIQARVKLVSGTYAMLMARYQDSDNYYFMTLRSSGTVEIKRMLGGSSGSALQTQSGVLSPAMGTWYTATLKVEGDSLQGYINGNLVLDVNDSTFASGLIGLGTSSGAAEFDDVIVSDSTPASYELSVSRTGTGSGAVTSDPAGIDCGITCTASFDSSTVVTLTAAPAISSTFAGWIGVGCGEVDTCAITMDASKAITAVFSSNTEPMLFVTKTGSGEGTVSSTPAGIDCGDTCAAGFDASTAVTLTATPAGGSIFSGWSGEGCSGTGLCPVTMDGIKRITATFTYIAYPLTVTKVGNGTGLVTSTPAGIDCGTNCTADFTSGTAVTLTATAGTLSTFAGWSGEGCSGTSPCVVMMDAARSVTATFSTYRAHLPLVLGEGDAPPPSGDEIYVAPDGSESAPGTISQPTTLPAAITRVEAGGTITMRGGTYVYATPVVIERGNDGAAGARKQLFAYPGETPILNFGAMAENSANRGLTVNGFYWHVKGLTVEYAGDNGIFIGGSYNIIERCITRYNRDTGLQLSRYSSSALQSEWPAYNLILSCESHDNMDSDGEDADGFAAKLTSGEGNVFRYCVSHNNIDDGWDMYTKSETGPIGAVTIEHCISYENGTLSDGTTHGNGDKNGYKLGGEDIPVDHVFRYNLAYDNGKHGITWNRNPGDMEVTGNVSIDSAERNFNFDGGSSTFSDNVSCRGSSGTNDRIIGTDLGTNCWWTDGANTCGASTCDPYSGELSWWFNPDGSLEYEFLQPDQGADLNCGDAKPASARDAQKRTWQALPVIGLVTVGGLPGLVLARKKMARRRRDL